MQINLVRRILSGASLSPATILGFADKLFGHDAEVLNGKHLTLGSEARPSDIPKLT